MIQIKIAAVGDLLMKSEIIASAKHADGYNFDPIFQAIKPYLKRHDVTIGNLETTFSGKKRLGVMERRLTCSCPQERRNPITGFPVFTCPDELASTLKKTGFHALTTANNHCMDGGAAGLKRTLNVLDKNGLKHTGTFRSLKESNKHLVLQVKGIKIGILSYTGGTNSIPVPKPWLVNRIELKKIAADIRRIKNKTDFLIVCLHFGQEFRTIPSKNQKKVMDFLFKHGVNMVVGSHPHVQHPVMTYQIKDMFGHVRNRVAASSLGNFVSTRLNKNSNTIRGMILSLTITKNNRGITDISKVDRLPTIVRRQKEKGRTVYRVLPMCRVFEMREVVVR